MQTKICTRCNQEKNTSEFYKDNSGKFGVYSICKICFNNKAKIFREKNKEQLKIYRVKNKNKMKIWRENNKNNLIEYRKKYYQENKEWRNKDVKEWKKNNKEKIKLSARKYHNKRRKYDIQYKITCNLRTRFCGALKKNWKYGSAVKNLGCSIEEFKKYFESLFTEGMTWEKVFDGSIHIDHKRPLASFNLLKPEEQEKACHYTNLQPLWAVDNLKKSDKWGCEMGRSVNYLDNAEVVLYFPFEGNESNEAGDYDEFLSQMNWDDMIDSLQCTIKAKLPSYYEVKGEWDNRETRIILKNNLCSIGISEYCGLVSLSVAPKNNEYDVWHEQFALRHARQIEKTLEKVLCDLGLKNLRKVGTFSNGEAVFELAK